MKLRSIVSRSGAEIWAKLEYRNPTGSMKDRMSVVVTLAVDSGFKYMGSAPYSVA